MGLGKRITLWLAVVLAVASPFGCGAGGPRVVRTELVPFSAEELQLRQAAQRSRYRLRVGDVFSVKFKYMTELDQYRIRILPDGHCTVAGLEDQMAAGLTVPELDSLLTAKLARDYRNPQLSVIVEELGTQKVYVLGEVRAPGLYDLPPSGQGALQAVALAGGFMPTAARSQTIIMRVTDGGFLYRRVDLGHPEKNGFAGIGALDVQPYDVVYVPRSAVGDLQTFSQTVLASLMNVGSLFWDVYGVMNLDKVDRLTR